jgi:hypothetical protein
MHKTEFYNGFKEVCTINDLLDNLPLIHSTNPSLKNPYNKTV